MISEFNLTNFKAFAGPERIPIRPLTLIFGPNSSGKSSIFQCLLMLKQTLEQPPSHVTPLRVKGDLVDLSSYREFVYRHDQEKNFTIGAVLPILNLKELDRLFCKFGFRAGNEYFSKLFQCIKKSQLGLQISFGYDEIRNRIRVSRIFLFIDDQVNPIVFYNGEFSIANKKHQFWKKYYKNCIKGNEQFFIDMILDNEQVKDDDKDKYIDKNIKIDNIEIAVELYHNYFSIYEDLQLLRFLPDAIEDPDECHLKGILYGNYSDSPYGLLISVLPILISFFVEQFLKNILYIGPLREMPERYYAFSGIHTDYVGASGRHFFDIMITDKTVMPKINTWFERLQVGYNLMMHPLSNPEAQIQDLYVFRLHDRFNGVPVFLTDVGFGLSQVLPIIVQSLVSRQRTILIEQPEYHLHPRLQAELGDLFIESAIGERGNTFFIETHSEHLILRILRRIRETSEGELPEGQPPLGPDQVAVLYVQPTPEGSKIIEIPVTAEGEFARPWPEGFFTERARELF